ncbi:hypothetical protein K466DRAFT_87228 [Polyporus arcularius HHB13444]|uniref:Uncharacterized protein n=1 Tax=Polyporus arcularius HHB13444 TaxID=1314778 RepID=A0A5C3PPY3_9APHY|nr:hypothetical protein K466DRAFT_87228 [Polyporus arcularius HHB13444]
MRGSGLLAGPQFPAHCGAGRARSDPRTRVRLAPATQRPRRRLTGSHIHIASSPAPASCSAVLPHSRSPAVAQRTSAFRSGTHVSKQALKLGHGFPRPALLTPCTWPSHTGGSLPACLTGFPSTSSCPGNPSLASPALTRPS